MKERILITGYNGELGSKTLKELVSIGKSVIALDINDPKEKIQIIGKTKEFIIGGICYNRSKERLTDLLSREVPSEATR